MTLPVLLLVVATAAQSPAGPGAAQPLPLHPRVEVGVGLGVTDSRVGLLPRIRGGASVDLGVPNLVLAGDIAGEAFITGEESNAFVTSSYWEVLLTPRLSLGYEIPVQAFSLTPYGYLGVSGGVRLTTIRFFGRSEDRTDIAFGGRVGLGLAFALQLFLVSLELDAGWKDLGPSGSATLNVGLRF